MVAAATLTFVLACGESRTPVPSDVRERIDKVQATKADIETRLSDVDRSLTLLKSRTDDELVKIRDSLESIQHALRQMQEELDALEAAPPSEPGAAPRLPLGVSVLLVVIIVFSVLLYLKLRRMRVRETRLSRSQEAPVEAAAPPPEPETKD
jgi:hypothetical protein